MKILIATVIIASAVLLVYLLFKMLKYSFKFIIWFVIVAAALALTNYVILPLCHVRPLPLGRVEGWFIGAWHWIRGAVTGLCR